ncbi:uncharacterized protein LODBEIA_P01300 [Lodderomyces beijingensis]|uniref:Uncharacterized protein n=1 Tax=Lodderomyces beijingensis TaxID=1775926 RepID=A0ABP0ZCK0_9ASCO
MFHKNPVYQNPRDAYLPHNSTREAMIIPSQQLPPPPAHQSLHDRSQSINSQFQHSQHPQHPPHLPSLRLHEGQYSETGLQQSQMAQGQPSPRHQVFPYGQPEIPPAGMMVPPPPMAQPISYQAMPTHHNPHVSAIHEVHHDNGSHLSTRRGPWSPLEDKKLLDLITLYGPTNWVRISNSLETRTPKQCRERYHQNLKPSLNRAPISPEEGDLIEKLVAQHGKKWAEISRHLNGRSDNAIKNWWNGGANRRRRASIVSVGNSHQDGDKWSNNELKRKSTDGDEFASHRGKSTSTLPPPPQPLASQLPSVNTIPHPHPHAHAHAHAHANPNPNPNPHPLPHQLTQVSNAPHLPQISFNTSMFGKKNNSEKPTIPSISDSLKPTTPPPVIINGQLPWKPLGSRSASFDLNSATLPPIIQSNKRRLIDDQFNRRHSSATSMLIQAHSNGSHLNLQHSYPSLPNFQPVSGNVSPSYHGSPLMMNSVVSRNNSDSHFELMNNSTNASSRRSSLIAPEYFPNAFGKNADSQLHKRHISQNSSFNSPQLTPSTRFSVCSANSILNPSSLSNASVTMSSYKNEHSTSSTSIHRAVEEEDYDEESKTSGVSKTSESRDTITGPSVQEEEDRHHHPTDKKSIVDEEKSHTSKISVSSLLA